MALALASSCVMLFAPACGSPQAPPSGDSCPAPAAAERQDQREGGSQGPRGTEESLLCVPQVLVISLTRREDKWQSIESRLRVAGFRNYERVDAVNGRNMTIDHVKRVVSDDALTHLGKHPQRIDELKDLRTLGAIACFLSHLSAWQIVVERGWERALILEDDVHFSLLPDNAWQIFGGGDPCVGLDWGETDVVLLGFYDGLGRDGRPYSAERAGSGFKCPQDADRWRGHAYIVSNRAAALLVSEALPLSLQVDYYMGKLVAQGVLSCRAGYQELITEPTSHTGLSYSQSLSLSLPPSPSCSRSRSLARSLYVSPSRARTLSLCLCLSLSLVRSRTRSRSRSLWLSLSRSLYGSPPLPPSRPRSLRPSLPPSLRYVMRIDQCVRTRALRQSRARARARTHTHTHTHTW